MKTIVLFLCLSSVLATSCRTSESDAINTLESAGFSEINVGGANMFACGEDDMPLGRDFTATNAIGRRVSGTVCCGWPFKNCTVRF